MESAQERLQRARELGLDAEIVTAPSGLRIREYDQIENSSGQLIIDATTLLAAGRTIPVVLERGLPSAQESCTKAEIDGTLSLIQALVIHDHVWVDALTFARSEKSKSIASILAPFISGFIVSRDFYRTVYEDIRALRGKLFKEFTSNHDFDLESVEDLDRKYIHPLDSFSPPVDCRKSACIIFEYDEDRRNFLMPEIPWELADSNTGIARTLFYIAISAHLQHPYMPHPDRSVLINQISSKTARRPPIDMANQIVNNFDSTMLEQLREGTLHLDFPDDMPPVAKYVLSRCKNESDLTSSIGEAREQASEFRNWCNELEDAYRSGRPGLAKRQQMERLLHEALDKWKSDMNEGVKYVTRKISFPVLEKFIKIDVNWNVRDHVLWSGYKPLLFLNSLYRDV